MRPFVAFAALVVIVLGGLIWLAYSTISYVTTGGGTQPATHTTMKKGWVFRSAERAMTAIRGRPNPTIIDYFANLEDWVSGTVVSTGGERYPYGSGEWTCTASGAEPGVLRIWKPSTDLGDYDLLFRGRVTVGGLGWAVRATDARNLYGIRLAPNGSGGVAGARLERFVRAAGGDFGRVSTPLSFNLLERVEYNVAVKVRGSQFTVTIDGQLADVWADERLRRGGVGFFSERGDASVIRWVELTERDSRVGRALGYFAFTPPPMLR